MTWQTVSKKLAARSYEIIDEMENLAVLCGVQFIGEK